MHEGILQLSQNLKKLRVYIIFFGGGEGRGDCLKASNLVKLPVSMWSFFVVLSVFNLRFKTHPSSLCIQLDVRKKWQKFTWYFFLTSFSSACCRCANLECGSEYDMDFIESQLIDMVQKQSMAFVLQDLKCGKCLGVSILACTCYLFCKQLGHTLLLEMAWVTSIDHFWYIEIQPRTLE